MTGRNEKRGKPGGVRPAIDNRELESRNLMRYYRVPRSKEEREMTRERQDTYVKNLYDPVKKKRAQEQLRKLREKEDENTNQETG